MAITLLIHASPALCCHTSQYFLPSFSPTSSEWVSASHECRYSGWGGGVAELLQSVEEAEWRQQNNGPWRLDVRGMLLSKLYHSVTQQDQSPQTAAQLLSLCFLMFHHSRWPSQVLFFSSAFSPCNSNFIHFHFFPRPTILSLSSQNCWVNLYFLCLTSPCPSITTIRTETLNWGWWCPIKLSYLTPPSLSPIPSHLSIRLHLYVFNMQAESDIGWGLGCNWCFGASTWVLSSAHKCFCFVFFPGYTFSQTSLITRCQDWILSVIC